MPKMPWPPKPEELNGDYLNLPDTLMLFLRILLMGNSVEGKPQLQRVVQSLAQDCVYAISGASAIPAQGEWHHCPSIGFHMQDRSIDRGFSNPKEILEHTPSTT